MTDAEQPAPDSVALAAARGSPETASGSAGANVWSSLARDRPSRGSAANGNPHPVARSICPVPISVMIERCGGLASFCAGICNGVVERAALSKAECGYRLSESAAGAPTDDADVAREPAMTTLLKDARWECTRQYFAAQELLKRPAPKTSGGPAVLQGLVEASGQSDGIAKRLSAALSRLRADMTDGEAAQNRGLLFEALAHEAELADWICAVRISAGLPLHARASDFNMPCVPR